MVIEPKHGKHTVLGLPKDFAVEIVAGVLRNNGVAVTLSDWVPFITPLGVIPTQSGEPFCAPLQNGYVKTASQDKKYSVEYQICLSTEKIEAFFNAIADRILPESIFALLEWYDISRNATGKSERSFQTPFLPKEQTLTALRPYMFRLVNDGFVAFGCAWGDPSSHEEVFVGAKKIINIMTSKSEAVDDVLRQFGIASFKPLRFINEYQTLNGDLGSLAEIFPTEYANFKANEYLSSIYVPELVQLLGFKEE
jgi:hypothetical protein